MNKEFNESMKLKNHALFRKVLKKNEIISDEKKLHDCEKKCIIDGALPKMFRAILLFWRKTEVSVI